MMNKLFKLDWILIFVTLLLLGVGVLIMYSLTAANLSEGNNIFTRQVSFGALGLVAMFFFALTDYHYLRSYSRTIYFGALALLVIVLFLGVTVRGTSGWLGFQSISFQPVEFAKIALIVFLASFISQKKSELSETTRLVVSLCLMALMVFLVLRQPDLGSALVLVSIWAGVVVVSGISKKKFAILLLIGMVIALGSWPLFAGYQKDRIMTFLHPERDPRGSGYNVIQAMIAVGSGGLRGEGIGRGSQSQLNFLPEKHTDFVYSVVAEELGILGAFLVLALYLTLLYRIKRIAASAPDNFGFLIATGVMTMLLFQMVVNIGMNIGAMPVTGITLPLVSYGGSSLLAVLASIGIVLNVGMRRNMFDTTATISGT